MRSQFVDKFNHDADASAYDQDVLNERDPIRDGYSDLLDWVAKEARIGATCSVIDLGAGTGNLSDRLPSFNQLLCVDVSREMLRIARAKLFDRENVHFVESDILQFFELPQNPCDSVVSTYAIHHLTEPEKEQLFRAVATVLKPGGVAAFGDLMFENAQRRHQYREQLLRSGQFELAEVIDEEFFWDVERAVGILKALGFVVTVKQFSELSWGLAAQKARHGPCVIQQRTAIDGG